MDMQMTVCMWSVCFKANLCCKAVRTASFLALVLHERSYGSIRTFWAVWAGAWCTTRTQSGPLSPSGASCWGTRGGASAVHAGAGRGRGGARAVRGRASAVHGREAGGYEGYLGAPGQWLWAVYDGVGRHATVHARHPLTRWRHMGRAGCCVGRG